MILGPIVLSPVLVAKPWGGRRLAEFGTVLPADGTWGESWVVADLDPAATSVADPASRVASGPQVGACLAELMDSDVDALLGDGVHPDDGRFPLLVKFLDAHQDLSIQVHPPADVAGRYPGDTSKTESWVVLDAAADASILLGLADGATEAQVRDALGTPALVGLLQRIPVHAGDFFHLPAGIIHSLGTGVLVAEVQTPSDTTYRLYDWTQEYDRAPRPLHLERGWEAIQAAWELNVCPPSAGHPSAVGGLITTQHYAMSRHLLDSASPLRDGTRRARIVVVLDGQVRLTGLDLPLGRGGVAVVPAASDLELFGVADILLVTAA